MVLALCLIQRIAFGGEWRGASLMVVEHSPSRRALYGSLVELAGISLMFILLAPITFVATLFAPRLM